MKLSRCHPPNPKPSLVSRTRSSDWCRGLQVRLLLLRADTSRLGKADAGVANWTSGVSSGQMFLSSITIHELEHWVLLAERTDADGGPVLRQWLDKSVLQPSPPV